MKRLYMMPNSSLRVLGPNGEFVRWQQVQTGLDHSTDPPTPVMTDIAGLFAGGEHHAIFLAHDVLADDVLADDVLANDVLANDVLLMITRFDNERHEDWFHDHPHVAILPHPTMDGNLPLNRHIGRSGYKFTQGHLDSLTRHPRLGVAESDTVLTLQKKAAAINGNFKLRNVL
jgi:hypothetical protein